MRLRSRYARLPDAILGRVPVTKAMSAHIDSVSAISEKTRQLQDSGKKVVFTNGCFDILHAGHVDLLQRSRDLGDVLVLAINSDASVQRMKGPNRPIIPEQERAELLAG